MNKNTVLIVEDDARIRHLMATTLKLHEYKYDMAKNGKDALMQTLSNRPDIVLHDL